MEQTPRAWMQAAAAFGNAAVPHATCQCWPQGTYNPGAIPEPNNLAGNELCAVGNWSQKVNGLYSWSDTGCSGNYIYMCWVRGEMQLPPGAQWRC